MANYSVMMSRECGALSDKPVQYSFEASPGRINEGLGEALKLWAETACVGECLSISVRRDL